VFSTFFATSLCSGVSIGFVFTMLTSTLYRQGHAIFASLLSKACPKVHQTACPKSMPKNVVRLRRPASSDALFLGTLSGAASGRLLGTLSGTPSAAPCPGGYTNTKDAACRFVSVRAGLVFEGLRFVPVRVILFLRVTRFVSRVSEIRLRVMRVGIRAPHYVFVCLRVSRVSRVMRVEILACHACRVSCVSGSVAVRFVSVSSSCVFAVRVCFCASLKYREVDGAGPFWVAVIPTLPPGGPRLRALC
jgi:hypothetical protein